MKAAVMHGPSDIRIEMIDKPICEDDGLILKIEAVGLCGSDIRNLTTDSRAGDYPHVYGHETVGIVAEVGKNVTRYAVGDRLFVHPGAPCGVCEYCREGEHQLCAHTKTYADFTTGGFAEYLSVPGWGIARNNNYIIPENVEFTLATLGEPLSSVYSCQRNMDIKIGETIAIIGAGPIGCFHAELAKIRGAHKVIMVDISEERLKNLEDFGVDETINSSITDPVEAVLELTDGKGADKVISANPSTEAQKQGIFMCAPGGIIALFGGVPRGKLTEIDSNKVHYSNLWIYGHYAASLSDCKKAFELIVSGQFKADKYITHVMPLEEINEAIALAKSGEALKVVLIP